MDYGATDPRTGANESQHRTLKPLSESAVNRGKTMQLTRPHDTLAPPADPPDALRTAAPARERNKRANVSQDAALYSCSCGYVFKAAVTTSVGCPHCGTAQAW